MSSLEHPVGILTLRIILVNPINILLVSEILKRIFSRKSQLPFLILVKSNQNVFIPHTQMIDNNKTYKLKIQHIPKYHMILKS